MFLTVHATVGIIIGQATQNVWLAFIAGVISHFLIDIIPHGDQDLKEGKKIFRLALMDGVVLLVLLSILYQQGFLFLSLTVLSAMAGAIFPDAITGLYLQFKFPRLEKYLNFHVKLHNIIKKPVLNFQTGLVVQLVFLVLFLAIIVFN